MTNPLRVNALVNGESLLPPQTVVVGTRGLTFDVLLDRLTARLKPAFGAVRRLYALDGTRIAALENVTDDAYVVVAGSEPFKAAKYLDHSSSPQKKEKTVVTSGDSLGARSVTKVAEGRATRLVEAVKPRIVLVLRNGDLGGQPSRVLLPPNVTWDQALFIITERVKLDTGAVRKLYSLSGEEVRTVEALVDMERYIACGREALRPIDPALVANLRQPTLNGSPSKPANGKPAAAAAYAGKAAITTNHHYDAVEKEFKDLLGNPKRGKDLEALWTLLDFNGNSIVSLAEIDKLMVEKYPVLNNKPALMRAYKQTTLRDGDGDAWVERKEFPALLRNLVYFNKLFAVFEDIDADHDRRLTLEEFKHGCGRLGLKLSPQEAQQAFVSMDTNDGQKVLFDEFCAWVAQTACPVDGTVVKTFTTNDSRPVENGKAHAGNGVAGPKAGGAAGGGAAANKSKPGIHTTKFDATEKEFQDLLGNPKRTADLVGLWDLLDFNNNNIVSLAEIDKLVVEKYPALDNKPALMRAYKQTTLRDGDGDAWVERKEFPALLRNLVYFNKLFAVFEDIDADHDRRLTLEEFKHGCGRLGLQISPQQAESAFNSMDSNHGGKVLFDEFCAWVAQTACPVDGTVVKTFTTTDSRPDH